MHFKQFIILCKFRFITLLLGITGALARITEVPSNNFIIKGTKAEFQCCSDIPKTFFWQVKNVGLRHTKDIYTDGLVNGFRDTGRFNVTADSSSGCNKLMLSEVKLEDAGTYSCVDDEGLGQKIIWELTVIESFNCRGTNPKSEYMGHNSFGLPQDVISTVCISKYLGNVPPTLNCKWLSGRQTFSIHQLVTKENFTTTLSFQIPAIKELNDDQQLCYVEITGKSSDNNQTAWKSPRLVINYAEFQHNLDSKCSVDGLSLDCQPPCEPKKTLLSNGLSYCGITYPSKTQNTFYVSLQDYSSQGNIHTLANIPDETKTTSWETTTIILLASVIVGPTGIGIGVTALLGIYCCCKKKCCWQRTEKPNKSPVPSSSSTPRSGRCSLQQTEDRKAFLTPQCSNCSCTATSGRHFPYRKKEAVKMEDLIRLTVLHHSCPSIYIENHVTAKTEPDGKTQLRDL